MSKVAGRRGDGGVYWREERQRYEVRVRERPGDRSPKSFYSPGPRTPENEARAQDLRREKLAARVAGVRSVPGRLTVGTWLDQWLELKRRTAPATWRAYETRIRLYLKPELGRIRLRDLDEVDVARAFERLESRRGERVERLSAGTLDAAYRCLNAALGDAVKVGKAPRNAAALVSVARSEPEIVPPSVAELDRFFEALGDHPYRPILLALRWTGAREGEILGLRHPCGLDVGTVEIVRQATGRLKTRKSRRTLPLPPAIADEIAAIPRRLDSNLVFPSAAGTPVNPRNLLRVFDETAAKAGIRPPADADLDKYRPHDLRHAFATMLLQAGATPPIVQAWLGHASLRELDRYGHVRPIPGGDAYRTVVGAWGEEAAMLLGLTPRHVIARLPAMAR